METVKEGCRGQRKQPIGTSGSRTWGTQSKSEIGVTRIRRWVDTEGTSLRGRQEKDAPSAGQTRLARAQRGCKLARGDCQACRKTKASQASGRHAWRKHVGNSKGQKRLGQGRSLWGSLSVAQTGMLEGRMLYTAHMQEQPSVG